MLTNEQKKIVEDNIGLAYDFVIRAKKTGHTLYIARMDDDDMLSIAFYALCVAAEIFDKSLGYAFSTLFNHVCVNEYRKILRGVVDKRHGPYFSTGYLSDPKPGTNSLTVQDTIKDDSPSPDELCMEKQEKEALHSAVYSLDETLRNTVLMYHFGGLGQKDIAHAHDVLRSAVSRRLDRAYQRIAAHMAANGYCA